MNPTIDKLCVRSQSAKKLKIVNTGLKLFEYNSRKCECAYRVCQEGIPVLLKHMTKRVVKVPLEDFLRILETQRQAVELDVFSEITRVGEGE